ncbi:hypothetical protein SAMN05216509_5352 [Pseudomonas sp. B10]|nr:hypothetical protein SAMN05216509_5352 [Pseudomonas sp. B10]
MGKQQEGMVNEEAKLRAEADKKTAALISRLIRPGLSLDQYHPRSSEALS